MLVRLLVFRFRIQRLFPDVNSWALVHKVKGAAPPGFIEEVTQGVENIVATLLQALIRIGTGWHIERPENKQRTADNVGARNKSPVPAVEAGIAVVAHHEVTAVRHNQVIALNMLSHFDWPVGRGRISAQQRISWKVVAFRLIVLRIMDRVRLIQFLPIAVNPAGAKMNT